MDLNHFTREARILMNRHSLHHVPLELDRGRRRIGACHVRTVVTGSITAHTIVKLTFSHHYVALLGWDELEDVVLHEIAHALTPGSNHDYAFMRKCREIGAVPARCKAPTARPEFTVTALCPKCSRQLGGQFRLPTRVYVCNTCRDGSDKVILVWYRKGIEVPLHAMPSDYQNRVNRYNQRRAS